MASEEHEIKDERLETHEEGGDDEVSFSMHCGSWHSKTPAPRELCHDIFAASLPLSIPLSIYLFADVPCLMPRKKLRR